jgi:hypothetical protein
MWRDACGPSPDLFVGAVERNGLQPATGVWKHGHFRRPKLSPIKNVIFTEHRDTESYPKTGKSPLGYPEDGRGLSMEVGARIRGKRGGWGGWGDQEAFKYQERQGALGHGCFAGEA